MQILPSTINRNTRLSFSHERGKHLPRLAFGATLLLMLLSFEAIGQTSTPTPTPAPNRPCPTELIAPTVPPTPQPTLQKVPEIVSVDGKLRGTIILSDEQEWIPNRIPVAPPQNKSRYECSPQYVRTFRELGAKPTMASAPKGTIFPGSYALPRPGPTLRARVGDLVQLTFINQINPIHFGESMDRAEQGRGNGCDETSIRSTDVFPDCFHGSSTGNIHFHGTHTNPNTTGDNVFIEVRPSVLPGTDGKPIVTPDSVANSFNQFFTKCEAELKNNVLKEWPTIWGDLPSQWTAEQQKLLQDYDQQMRKLYGPGVRPLWPVDEAQLKAGAWPQYYFGAYPYCFRLPEYKEQVWPPKPASTMAGMGDMNMQSGDDNRALMMGQAPGTHWYHAHKHGSTAINVANGMTGAFIIEGQYDDDLNNFYGQNWTREQKVLVINQLGVSPNRERGVNQRQDKGPDFEVNGQLRPIIDMRPGEVQMWRIVNTSGRAGIYFLPPGTTVPDVTTQDVNGNPFVCPKPTAVNLNKFQWKQLAQDGVQFKDANYQRPVLPFAMFPGNRVDLLVKAPPCGGGADCVFPVTVQNEVDPRDLSSACPLTLMSVRVSGTAVDPKTPAAQFIPTAPKFPAFLQDISDAEVSGTKTLTFAASAPGPTNTQTIDGKKFDGEIGEVILLNKVEEWKIVNATFNAISHPFHIHINPFQVVEVFDPNEILTDDQGNQVVNPVSKQPVFRYVFQRGGILPGQCYLDPFGKAEDWKPCEPKLPNKDNIWWDVFAIPSGRQVTVSNLNSGQTVTINVPGYFKMRSRFVDYPGQYVIHCHILAHEDRGMMNIVEVVPYKTPYSHQ